MDINNNVTKREDIVLDPDGDVTLILHRRYLSDMGEPRTPRSGTASSGSPAALPAGQSAAVAKPIFSTSSLTEVTSSTPPPSTGMMGSPPSMTRLLFSPLPPLYSLFIPSFTSFAGIPSLLDKTR